MIQKIIIGITQGDTNGIGYEVIIKALADNRMLDMCTPVIYGSSKFIAHYRKLIGGIEQFNVNVVSSAAEAHPKRINLVQCVPDTLTVEPGKQTVDGAKAALAALQVAVQDLKDSKIQAVVTAPFSKQTVNEGGFAFPGHTEYFASEFNTPQYLMLLCSERLKIGVVTGHIPLYKVSESLNKELILSKIKQLNETLKFDFQISKPKIAVLGLNPHAGDGGLLGKEEAEIIGPAIAEAYKQGIFAFGPYPADGFFGAMEFRKVDAVLAMYHDQGLIPFKTVAFHDGVNFTAGLPIVRTSPDHGTAYDIAGTDSALPDSMIAALYAAHDFYKARQDYATLRENPLKPVRFEGPQAG